ncbi:MAG: hypothetical protein CM1200mP16_02780 [Nitrospina sp.]|nr:MAG: hypothetical protein CM1200mP16_02780 [Nitrospina sp.]
MPLGFGLGYHLEPLLEKIGPDGFLLVKELNPDLLSAAMKLKNHTQLFYNNRFKLIFGVDEFDVSNTYQKKCTVSQNLVRENRILFHPHHLNVYPKFFPGLKNALEILLIERVPNRFP